MINYIAYYRISTKHQIGANNVSLGIESQKTSVRNFIGTSGTIVDEYVEVESGKNNQRPILEKAIQDASKIGATLIIAKLDRLSREVSFLFQLRDRAQRTGVKIKSLDMPDMNTLNLGIYSTISQHERETIALRTKISLAELKKTRKLGTPQNLTNEAKTKGRLAVIENAKNNDNNRQAVAVIVGCISKGHTYKQIATYLNELNFRTRYGNNFKPMSVLRLYNRYKIESAVNQLE